MLGCVICFVDPLVPVVVTSVSDQTPSTFCAIAEELRSSAKKSEIKIILIVVFSFEVKSSVVFTGCTQYIVRFVFGVNGLTTSVESDEDTGIPPRYDKFLLFDPADSTDNRHPIINN